MFVPDRKPYSPLGYRLRAAIIVLLVPGSVQSLLRQWFDIGDSAAVRWGVGIPLLACLGGAIAGFLLVQRRDGRRRELPALDPAAGTNGLRDLGDGVDRLEEHS